MNFCIQMNYNPKNWTYGCELEFADVDISNALPNGCVWNTQDYSIVNSNGIANDPKGISYKYGGEINTKPTKTIKEQIDIIKEILQTLNPAPTINYRCALHIHIGVIGLKNDLESLKKLFAYSYSTPFDLVSPHQKPTQDMFTKEEMAGAKKEYNRASISHRKKPSQKKFMEIMQAKTPQEFFEAHAAKSNGKLHWAITPRHGINLRTLWEFETIEFRLFYGTLDIDEYMTCFVWCQEFIHNALNVAPGPWETLNKYLSLKFPQPKKFDNELCKTQKITNVYDQNRQQAIKNIALVCNLDNEKHI